MTGLAQCASSKTRTAGLFPAMSSTNRSHAVKFSSRGAAGEGRPSSGRTLSASHSASGCVSTARRSLASAAPSPSSPIAACSFTIWASGRRLRPSPYAWQHPLRQAASTSGRSSSQTPSSCTRRDLPMPASAVIRAKRDAPDATAASNSAPRQRSSDCRPTKALANVRVSSSPGRWMPPSTSQGRTSARLPLSWTGGMRENSATRAAIVCVSSPTATPPAGASVCRRAAMLTESPTRKPCPEAGSTPRRTSAGPVFTPIRARSRLPSHSGSSVIRSWSLTAALTARSASSSWIVGKPKTPATASPMNFSTVPPYCSMTCLVRA